MAQLARSDAEGQIQILLEEYRSLRDEAKQRVGERMVLLSVFTAAAALIASAHNAVWAYVAAALFLVVAASVWLRSWRILDKLGGRLAVLEQAINGLAAEAYPLGALAERLRWETMLQEGRKALAEADGLKGRYGSLIHPDPERKKRAKRKPDPGQRLG